MNANLSDPTRPAAMPRQPTVNDQADRLIAAVNDALTTPTRYRDHTPLPAIGAALPVDQPGRPPMSQRAVDRNTTILTSSVLTLAAGTATTGILWASGHADPTVIGLMAAIPAGLAVPVLALSRLVKRVKDTVEAAPPVHHHHYEGSVVQDHRSVNTTTRGLWANTRNQLPK